MPFLRIDPHHADPAGVEAGLEASVFTARLHGIAVSVEPQGSTNVGRLSVAEDRFREELGDASADLGRPLCLDPLARSEAIASGRPGDASEEDLLTLLAAWGDCP